MTLSSIRLLRVLRISLRIHPQVRTGSTQPSREETKPGKPGAHLRIPVFPRCHHFFRLYWVEVQTFTRFDSQYGLQALSE